MSFKNRIAALQKQLRRAGKLRTAAVPATDDLAPLWEWADGGCVGVCPMPERRPADYPSGDYFWPTCVTVILCRIAGVLEPDLGLTPIDRSLVELLVPAMRDENFQNLGR